jgi:anti-anti-sigma factor
MKTRYRERNDRMSIRRRAVKVHHVPEQVTAPEERAFLQNLQKHGEAERPRFVLDCSSIWDMDIATIHLLLSCLEVVMKGNGDVRLASLRPGAEEALRIAGVDRLFEIYETTEAAVQSFADHSTSIVPLAFEAETMDAIANAERDRRTSFGLKSPNRNSFEVKK